MQFITGKKIFIHTQLHITLKELFKMLSVKLGSNLSEMILVYKNLKLMIKDERPLKEIFKNDDKIVITASEHSKFISAQKMIV